MISCCVKNGCSCWSRKIMRSLWLETIAANDKLVAGQLSRNTVRDCQYGGRRRRSSPWNREVVLVVTRVGRRGMGTNARSTSEVHGWLLLFLRTNTLLVLTESKIPSTEYHPGVLFRQWNKKPTSRKAIEQLTQRWHPGFPIYLINCSSNRNISGNQAYS